ncbi:MAG: hypothetical protein IMZ50_16380 [Candidatus Atribacteria bacterium]|nr:hypothetical protein [Candidatus Atribacteria bacterium]
MADWPKGPYRWQVDDVLYVSIPFTWNLPTVRAELQQGSWLWNRAVVGGPATRLMPDYLAGVDGVTVGDTMPGILQRVNLLATRTSIGCPRKCAFCGVRVFEPEFAELDDWPDLPIICDNNLMACSLQHIERVCYRLAKWEGVDFNQGLDARLMTDDHARLLAIIPKAKCRMSCDSIREQDDIAEAAGLMQAAGIPKSRMPIYALIAFDTDPQECWTRLLWLEAQHFTVCPMWYHALDCLQWNTVTDAQKALGWSDKERTRIMGYFYKRRGMVPDFSTNGGEIACAGGGK